MNKPVAWIKEDTLIYLDNYNYASITIQVQKSKSVGFDIPLYTHPVKELTLTDEQINALDNEVKYSELSLDWHEYMRRFARLVLKKAYYGEI